MMRMHAPPPTSLTSHSACADPDRAAPDGGDRAGVDPGTPRPRAGGLHAAAPATPQRVAQAPAHHIPGGGARCNQGGGRRRGCASSLRGPARPDGTDTSPDSRLRTRRHCYCRCAQPSGLLWALDTLEQPRVRSCRRHHACSHLRAPSGPPQLNLIRSRVAAGGVTKEWFQLLIRELFQPAFGMFEYLEETREFWFSPAASHIGVSKEDFRMVGIVLGLAIFNGVILDVHFPLVRPPPPPLLACHSLLACELCRRRVRVCGRR